MRYRLRTLLILLAVGPPLLAWAWLYAVPIVTSLAFSLFATILAACMFGAVLGRTLLWGIEGILTLFARLIAVVRCATGRNASTTEKGNIEFSLSRFASRVKTRRQVAESTRLNTSGHERP
jgi:hypothetical protein